MGEGGKGGMKAGGDAEVFEYLVLIGKYLRL